MRATPPSLRMSDGIFSSAITAQAWETQNGHQHKHFENSTNPFTFTIFEMCSLRLVELIEACSWIE